MIRDAVERNFEIIGEASGKVPRSVREEYPDIPWEKMKSLRNFIIHQYDEVEEVAVWNTVQRDLPDLKQQLLTIKLPK